MKQLLIAFMLVAALTTGALAEDGDGDERGGQSVEDQQHAR